MKKKTKKKKKVSSARRSTRKAAPRRRVKARKRKAAAGRSKSAGSRRPVARRRRAAASRKAKPVRSSRGAARPVRIVTNERLRERDPGPKDAGQSGDTEGLSGTATADSESVKELVEEGQSFEAGIVSGVENAKDADKGGVRTRQVPEDDVPQEYLDED